MPVGGSGSWGKCQLGKCQFGEVPVGESARWGEKLNPWMDDFFPISEAVKILLLFQPE